MSERGNNVALFQQPISKEQLIGRTIRDFEVFASDTQVLIIISLDDDTQNRITIQCPTPAAAKKQPQRPDDAPEETDE